MVRSLCRLAATGLLLLPGCVPSAPAPAGPAPKAQGGGQKKSLLDHFVEIKPRGGVADKTGEGRAAAPEAQPAADDDARRAARRRPEYDDQQYFFGMANFSWAYQRFVQSKKRGPADWDEFIQSVSRGNVTELAGQFEHLRRGEFQVVFSPKYTKDDYERAGDYAGQYVLAYPTDAAEKGGKVWLGDYDGRYVTAAQFRRLPLLGEPPQYHEHPPTRVGYPWNTAPEEALRRASGLPPARQVAAQPRAAFGGGFGAPNLEARFEEAVYSVERLRERGLDALAKILQAHRAGDRANAREALGFFKDQAPHADVSWYLSAELGNLDEQEERLMLEALATWGVRQALPAIEERIAQAPHQPAIAALAVKAKRAIQERDDLPQRLGHSPPPLDPEDTKVLQFAENSSSDSKVKRVMPLAPSGSGRAKGVRPDRLFSDWTLEAITQDLESPEFTTRFMAVGKLAALCDQAPNPAVSKALVKVLSEADRSHVTSVLMALREWGTVDAIPALEQIKDMPGRAMAERAIAAIRARDAKK